MVTYQWFLCKQFIENNSFLTDEDWKQIKLKIVWQQTKLKDCVHIKQGLKINKYLCYSQTA